MATVNFPGMLTADCSLLIIIIIIRKESVGQKVHGFLSQLGEMEDTCDHQSNEHQRHSHIPHRGEDVVALGLGAIAMGCFQISRHLLISCLKKRKKVIVKT